MTKRGPKLHYDEREALYMKTIQKYNKEERALSTACSRNGISIRRKSRAGLFGKYLYEFRAWQQKRRPILYAVSRMRAYGKSNNRRYATAN